MLLLAEHELVEIDSLGRIELTFEDSSYYFRDSALPIVRVILTD